MKLIERRRSVSTSGMVAVVTVRLKKLSAIRRIGSRTSHEAQQQKKERPSSK
jgi:hypothetical protein